MACSEPGRKPSTNWMRPRVTVGRADCGSGSTAAGGASAASLTGGASSQPAAAQMKANNKPTPQRDTHPCMTINPFFEPKANDFLSRIRHGPKDRLPCCIAFNRLQSAGMLAWHDCICAAAGRPGVDSHAVRRPQIPGVIALWQTGQFGAWVKGQTAYPDRKNCGKKVA